MTRRPRAHAVAPHLYSYARAVEDMARLVEIARAGGDTRSQLLAEFEVLCREVDADGAQGQPRRLLAWQAIGNELQLRAQVAAFEAGVARDEEEELLEAGYEWGVEEIDAAVAERDDLTLVAQDDRTVIYATRDGQQVAWVRHENHPRWRYATEDLTEGRGFQARPENEPGAPSVSIPTLRVLDGGGDKSPLAAAIDQVEQLEEQVQEFADEEVQELLHELERHGATLRDEALQEDADLDLVATERERLEALLGQAGRDVVALTDLVRDAALTCVRVEQARNERRLARLRAEEADLMQASSGAFPEVDSPPGAEDPRVLPSAPGPAPDPVPPCLAFEEEQEALANLATELGTEEGRALALDHVRRATHPDQLAEIRAGIMATIESERRILEQLREHQARAQAEHAKRKSERAKPPRESALARARREARAADQATKDQPATKELRKRVLELIAELWPAPGTAPRSLISEVKESGYQALKAQEAQLAKQVAAKAAKPPAPAPIARGESVPAVEGWE